MEENNNVKETTKTPKAKGNKTTEAIIGSAALKLGSAVKSLTDAFKAAEGLEQLVEEGTLKVTNLESNIAELQNKLKQDKANASFELELAYKTDEKAFADKYLVDNGLKAVAESEWNNLNSQLKNVQETFDKRVSEETHKAIGAITKDHKNEMTIKEMEYRNKEAENLAAINQLKDKVAFLEDQVESWKAALDAERQAGVERAKASAIGTLNVGASKN